MSTMRKIKLQVLNRGVDELNPAKQRYTYRVIEVKNSLAYTPGQVLDHAAADHVSSSNMWDVTIIGGRD